VCVCGAATYTENVTMVEGVSVYGGFDCGTWSETARTQATLIQDTDANGLDHRPEQGPK
jgi:hypothetical protein